MQEIIEKTKRPVAITFVVLMIVATINAYFVPNAFRFSDFVLEKLLVPIIILSTLTSAYWVLLTDDFWLIYEGSDTSPWTKLKTGFKFLVWIPAMGLYFFAVIQGVLSIYNLATGD